MSIKCVLPECEYTTIQNIDNKYIEIIQGSGDERHVVHIPMLYADIFLNLLKANMLEVEQ